MTTSQQWEKETKEKIHSILLHCVETYENKDDKMTRKKALEEIMGIISSLLQTHEQELREKWAVEREVGEGGGGLEDIESYLSKKQIQARLAGVQPITRH